MNTQSNPQNELSSVLQKICEIAEKSADGDYIFRGESRSYGKVVSSLYRQYEYDIEADDFEIEFVQKEILDEARKYTEKTDELEILVELHYHGGITNLIEFTTDSHIALFFACDGAPSEDGRVILQKRDSVTGYLQQPYEPKQRIIAQKTVFVRPPKGFVNPDEVITIPAVLKLPMLEYLRKSHGISTETILNDLQDFIRNWTIHESAYTQFHRGNTCRKRAESIQNWDEKLKWYERAIVHYTEALELKPDFPEGYNNRGIAYYGKREYDKAIADFSEVIRRESDHAGAYNNRANAYRDKVDFNKAIADYTKAIEFKPDYAEAYYNRGKLYVEDNIYDKAIADFSMTIKFDPEHSDAHGYRADLYREKGEYDKAVDGYNMEIELRPDDPEVYYNLGETYGAKSECNKAVEDFSNALELLPGFTEAYAKRGLAYFHMGKFELAIQDYDKVLELKPKFIEVYAVRGIISLHIEEWESAKLDLTFARNLRVNIITEFHKTYESIANFEQINNVQLPEDIAAMLR